MLPVCVAVDVLSAHVHDLRPLPPHDRREVLEGLVEDAQAIFAVRRLTDNGHEAGPRCSVGASRASSGRTQVDVSSQWADAVVAQVESAAGGRVSSWAVSWKPPRVGTYWSARRRAVSSDIEARSTPASNASWPRH